MVSVECSTYEGYSFYVLTMYLDSASEQSIVPLQLEFSLSWNII